MEFKKYEVDAMLNDGDISDNIETETVGDDKAVENGEKNLMKKPLTVEEHRALRRKSKKNLARQNSKEGTLGVANAPNFMAPQRRWKNSRRPRNGQGRGMTKKAGGGRGNWGKMGSELLEEELLDENDPNYNEDEDVSNIKFEEIVCTGKLNSEDEFLKNFEMAMLEYFEHGDTHEVASEIDQHMRSGALRPLVIRKAVEMALEHKNSHREMTSVLLSDLYGRCLIASDYERGFDMLLNNLPDLILDTPDATHVLGNFIARAVADDCMPPKYVHQLARIGIRNSPKNGHENGDGDGAVAPSRVLHELAQQALDYAEGHLSMHTSWAHLDNVWGVTGGLRPVQTITKQMELLLKEYLISRDALEAQRCIIALEVPHFYHELIYEIIIMTLESMNEGVEEAMCKLIRSLEQTCVVTVETIEQGFQRVFDDIQDISLDIPLAYIILERFVQRCHNAGFTSEKIMKNLPSRGRKRFVSEGDSGLIKPNSMMFREF